MDVALEVGRLARIVVDDARDLLLHRDDARRQQALEAELVALALGERGPLVEHGEIDEQLAAHRNL